MKSCHKFLVIPREIFFFIYAIISRVRISIISSWFKYIKFSINLYIHESEGMFARITLRIIWFTIPWKILLSDPVMASWKFVTLEAQIIWIGSFQSNFESLLRLHDENQWGPIWKIRYDIIYNVYTIKFSIKCIVCKFLFE